MPKAIDPFEFVIAFRDQLESDGPEAALAKLQPKGPGAPDPEAFDQMRRRYYERVSTEKDVGAAVTAEMLPPQPASKQGLAAEEQSEIPAALRAVQEMVLAHPIAARRIFAALVAEGRRFAATREGRAWADRLADSELVQDARLVFQMTSLSVLEGSETPERLPSSYLDAFFRAAASDDTDELLDRLFEGGADAETG